jgi:CheY-like chemotaxis protein
VESNPEEEDLDNSSLTRMRLIPILVVGELGEETLSSLEQVGFTVHVASTGIEAIAALTSGLCPHLILLDMRVPERMDHALLAALQTQAFAELPVVILSNFDDFREDPVAKIFILPAFDPLALRRIALSTSADMRLTEGLLAEARQKLGGRGGRGRGRGERRRETLIMVVEDDADHRAAITDVLEEAGYNVATAAHGRQALAELSSQPRPALVLLDLMMPELDGWGFMEEVSRDPALSLIPVVVLSTGSKAMFDAAPTAAGYLRKPLDSRQLLRTIHDCLQGELSPPGTSDPGLRW